MEVDTTGRAVSHTESLGRLGPVPSRSGNIHRLLGQDAQLFPGLVGDALAHLSMDTMPALHALVDATDADGEADGGGGLAYLANDVLLVVMGAEATADADLMVGDTTPLRRAVDVHVGGSEGLHTVLTDVAVQIGQPRRIGLDDAQRRGTDGNVALGKLSRGLLLSIETTLLLLGDGLRLVLNDGLPRRGEGRVVEAAAAALATIPNFLGRWAPPETTCGWTSGTVVTADGGVPRHLPDVMPPRRRSWTFEDSSSSSSSSRTAATDAVGPGLRLGGALVLTYSLVGTRLLVRGKGRQGAVIAGPLLAGT